MSTFFRSVNGLFEVNTNYRKGYQCAMGLKKLTWIARPHVANYKLPRIAREEKERLNDRLGRGVPTFVSKFARATTVTFELTHLMSNLYTLNVNAVQNLT